MIAIIGAGPAGAVAAYELARQGQQVFLFEEHAVIGKPVACTGLVTKTIHRFLSDEELRPLIVNELHHMELVAPNGERTVLPTQEYVLDRAALDTLLVKRAIKVGAKLFLNHRFVAMTSHKGLHNLTVQHKGKNVNFDADIVIGADGPLSTVAKAANLVGERRFLIGSQVTLKQSTKQTTPQPQSKDIFTTWFGDVAPGFFAWRVPETNTVARVGLATATKTREHMDVLLAKAGGTILARQAGPIPVFNRHAKASDQKRRIFLVGDAALINKATTGGGIIVGMQSAQVLANCLSSGKNYERALRPLRKELLLHLAVRKALDSFGNKDYIYLLRLMRTPAVQRILAANTREYPSRWLWRLLIAEPRLLRFAPHALVGVLRSI